MKRLLFLLCLFALLGCSGKIIMQDESVRTVSSKDFFDLRLVVRGGAKFYICVDKNTDVLYVVGYNSINPIMNADGTCLTLEEWKSKK